MSITHTVTETTINGKRVVIAKDKTKNTTSMRSFAIPEVLKEIFLEMKEKKSKIKIKNILEEVIQLRMKIMYV